jgi:hypothetical protein
LAAAHHPTEGGAVQRPAQRDGQKRRDHQRRDLRSGYVHAPHRPLCPDRQREREALADQVGIQVQDGERELGDADRRHEHDHARCAEQPADDDQLDDRAVDGSDGEGHAQRQPIGHAVVHVQDHQQPGADEAHVADREVDDP